MGREDVIEIKGFKGINIRENPNMIQDDELVECVNFDIGRTGELIKREGFDLQNPTGTLGLNSVRLLGFFNTGTYHQILARAGNNLYRSNDGITYNLIGPTTVVFGIQYVDKFYMVSPTGFIVEWEGNGAQVLDADTRFATATVGAWVNKLNATVTRDSAQFHEGTHSIKAVATAASQMQIETTPGINGKFLVNPNDGQYIFGWVRCDTTGRTVELKIQYYTAAGALISTDLIESEVCSANTWTNLDSVMTVPATARYASLLWEVDSPAAGQVFHFDSHSWRDDQGREIKGSPSGTACYIFRDRLFVINSEGSTGELQSKVTFSEINDFSTSGWTSDNNLLVSPGDGDFLTAMSIIHDTLIVFKGQSTWGLYVQGEPDNWILRNLNPEIGCISKYTPREIEGFLFFVGPRGVYKTDGNIFEDISANISPAFEDRIVNLTNANIDCAAWWEDKYILLFNPTPSTRRYFAYHLRSGGWTEWEFGDSQPSFFLEINTTTPTKGLWAGDLALSGRVFKHGDNIRTDAGVEYECRIQTKFFDFGFPAQMKKAKWFAPEVEGAADIVWTNRTEDADKNVKNLASLAVRRAYKVGGAEYFRSWALAMAFTSDQEFAFYGLTLFMHQRKSLVASGT